MKPVSLPSWLTRRGAERWQPPAPDDYDMRRQARRISTLVIVIATVVGVTVAFVPRLWDDQEQIRYIVATLVSGLAAMVLAVVAIARMGRDLGGQPPLKRSLRPIRIGFPEGWSPPARAAFLEGSRDLGLDLAGVDLREAVLPGIDLDRADLAGAWLEDAELRGAALRGARLSDADLRKADLREARLQGADLRGAKMEGARLAGARHDEATQWPAGVDPNALGAIRAGEPRR